LSQRRFALIPMAEIASEWRHPITGKSVADLLADCLDESSVQLHHVA
jgi:2-amino-4-hydroxy-6-hydroxymethyldihydropteridine diphosphokinase